MIGLDSRVTDEGWWLHIKHICGHWERHLSTKFADEESAAALLRPMKCSECQKKDKEKTDGL
jgi:hypothetical protein